MIWLVPMFQCGSCVATGDHGRIPLLNDFSDFSGLLLLFGCKSVVTSIGF